MRASYASVIVIIVLKPRSLRHKTTFVVLQLPHYVALSATGDCSFPSFGAVTKRYTIADYAEKANVLAIGEEKSLQYIA